MAKVKIEDIVDHLSSEMKRAIADTLVQVAPNAQIDSTTFYKAFKKNVYRKCSIWENVPDHYVQKD